MGAAGMEESAPTSALATSEERLRLAQEVGRLGSWEYELRTGQMIWTEALWQLVGLEPGGVTPSFDLWDGLIHPDDRARRQLIRQRGLASAETDFQDEFRIIRPDGQTRWLMVRVAIQRDAAGRALRIIGVNADITERKAAEAERERLLREEQAARRAADRAARRMGALYALAADLVRATGADAVARALVEQTCQALGAVSSAVVLLSADGQWLELAAASGASPAETASWQRYPATTCSPFADAVRTGAPILLRSPAERVTHYPHLDGHPPYHEANQAWFAVPLHGHGRVVGAFGGSFTIPLPFDAEQVSFIQALAHQGEQALERTRLEAAARVERDWARFLAEAGQVLASSLDQSATLGKVAALAVPHLADYCYIDLIDTTSERLIRAATAHADPSLAALLWRYVPERPRPGTPLADVLADGRARLVSEVTDAFLASVARDTEHLALLRRLAPRSYLAVPLVARQRLLGVMSLVMAGSGRRYGLADRERAEEVAARAALAIDNGRLYLAEQAARQTAEAAVRARDEFLSIAAHELRTPVAGISGFAQRLSQALQRGTLDAVRLARAVAMISQASQRLTVLTADLLDISWLRTDSLPLNLEPVDLAEITAALVEQRREQGLERHRLVLERTPGPMPLSGDVRRLEQVIENLLSNAIKYSPEGGTITIRLAPERDGWCLTVTDQGIGLPAGAAGHIFEPLGRAANATARHLPGMGLGLAICKGIIERHSGRIWAESAGEGRGTSVGLWLPRGRGALASA